MATGHQFVAGTGDAPCRFDSVYGSQVRGQSVGTSRRQEGARFPLSGATAMSRTLHEQACPKLSGKSLRILLSRCHHNSTHTPGGFWRGLHPGSMKMGRGIALRPFFLPLFTKVRRR